MRVLLIHRYFWPDSPPYALILNAMAKMLIAEGYQVNVLSSMPSYKSTSARGGLPYKQSTEDGFDVYRLPVFSNTRGKLLKILSFILFPIMVFFFLLVKPRYNVVTVSSSPPVLLPFFVAVCSKIKRFQLVYHCMDLHPEIGKISGDFGNRLLYRLLMKMELFSCRVAKRIIVLSEDMRDSMIARDYSLQDKIVIINNFSLPSYDQSYDSLALPEKQASTKRLVFAGNLGRFQGLDLIVKALVSFNRPDDIELLFVGEGVALDKLKQLAAASRNIHFFPHQPVSVAKSIIDSSDFGIVSLIPGVVKYAFPSKTLTYLECGVPVLFFTDDRCEFACFLQSKNLGHSSELTDESRLHDVFEKIVSGEGKILSSRGLKDFYDQNFSQQIFNEKLQNLFGDLDE